MLNDENAKLSECAKKQNSQLKDEFKRESQRLNIKKAPVSKTRTTYKISKEFFDFDFFNKFWNAEGGTDIKAVVYPLREDDKFVYYSDGTKYERQTRIDEDGLEFEVLVPVDNTILDFKQ